MRISIVLLALLVLACGLTERRNKSFYLPCTEVEVTGDGIVGMPDYLQLAQTGADFRHMASVEYWFGEKCAPN